MGLPIATLLEQVAQLGPETAVFFTHVSRDAHGPTAFPAEALPQLSAASGAPIYGLFGSFVEAEKDGKPISKIFRNEDFGYRTITVERPLRDEAGNVVPGQRGKAKGQPQPDSSLRDTENVPLSDDEQTYFERDKTKVGYEIPFNQHFYVFTPPRPWR